MNIVNKIFMGFHGAGFQYFLDSSEIHRLFGDFFVRWGRHGIYRFYEMPSLPHTQHFRYDSTYDKLSRLYDSMTN